MGNGIGLGGILGFIILAGLAVNDAILFVSTADYNIKLRDKPDMNYGVIKAVDLRFRPIMITSMTTILALVPTIFANTASDEMMNIWKEFSLVVVFGIISSTFFALFFIPLCYSFLFVTENENRLLLNRKD